MEISSHLTNEIKFHDVFKHFKLGYIVINDVKYSIYCQLINEILVFIFENDNLITGDIKVYFETVK